MSEEAVPKPSESIERPVRCLLIDDYESIVRALNRTELAGLGFMAVVCKSFQSAIDAIHNLKPNILLLDNSLTPGGDEGIDIAKYVQEKLPDIKIYSTTANSFAIDQYETMGIGHIEKSDSKAILALLKD